MTLWINPIVLKKLELLYKKAPGEISGFGLVKRVDEKLIVYDIFIFKQECSRVSTELDPSKMLDYIEKHPDSLENVKLWWHTHKGFAASWSKDDEDTIETLISVADWFISIVIGEDETLTRFDMSNPLRITEDDIEIEPRIFFSEQVLQNITQWVKKEIKEKVEDKKYQIETVKTGFMGLRTVPPNFVEYPVCHSIEEFNERQKEMFGPKAHVVGDDAIDLNSSFSEEDTEKDKNKGNKKEEKKGKKNARTGAQLEELRKNKKD